MNNSILKFGIGAGVLTIVYMLIFYSIDETLMFSPWVTWSSFVIYIAAMLKATLNTRAKSEGFFTFREGLRPAFGVYVVASVTYFIFNYILYNYINPELPEIQREIMVKQAADIAEKLGRPELREQMENIKAEDLRVSLRNSALGFMWSLMGGFVLSAIIAFATKRDR
jgi:hypothetical protein